MASFTTKVRPTDPKRNLKKIESCRDSESEVTKTEVKSKSTSTSTSSSKVTTTTTKTARTRNVRRKFYSLVGQKFDPPEKTYPVRIFYESLHNQKPNSEMAEIWMMEHGLLSPVEAMNTLWKKQQKQKELLAKKPAA